jgi:hypothetical protein
MFPQHEIASTSIIFFHRHQHTEGCLIVSEASPRRKQGQLHSIDLNHSFHKEDGGSLIG